MLGKAAGLAHAADLAHGPSLAANAGEMWKALLATSWFSCSPQNILLCLRTQLNLMEPSQPCIHARKYW